MENLAWQVNFRNTISAETRRVLWNCCRKFTSPSDQEHQSTSTRETDPQSLCRPPPTLHMLCYLTLPGGRRRAFTLIKNQLKQSCIDMHQITASQHCLRSLNMIDCNNLIMYQLLVFCLSSLVAVFQCLKWYKCYTWQGVMSRKMPSNCFCRKREKRTKESTLAHAVCGFMDEIHAPSGLCKVKTLPPL